MLDWGYAWQEKLKHKDNAVQGTDVRVRVGPGIQAECRRK